MWEYGLNINFEQEIYKIAAENIIIMNEINCLKKYKKILIKYNKENVKRYNFKLLNLFFKYCKLNY